MEPTALATMTPINGNTVSVALVDVSADGVAETFAVASAVARATILDTLSVHTLVTHLYE